MKRYLVVLLLLVAAVACTPSEDKMVMGKWKIVTRGVDATQKPCMFIPETMELFGNGTIWMSIMPPTAKMFYKTAVTRDEMRSLKKRYPGLKDDERVLLMKVTEKGDWAESAVAYNYTANESQLSLELPGWTPSVYGRVK